MRIPKRLLASPVILVWLTWSAILVPRLLQSLTSPKHRTTVRSESTGYSTIASLADSGLRYLLLGYCLVIIASVLLNRSAKLNALFLVFLAPWLVLVLRDLILGLSPDVNTFFYPLIGAAVWFLRPQIEHLKHLGYAIGVTAAIAIALGLVLPDAGLYRQVGGELIEPDKQILPWGILVGPFTSGNNLAQFLVLGLPAAFLITRIRTRLTIVLLVAIAIVWTSSRASLMALGVCLVLAVLLSTRSALLRGIIAAGGMLATGLVAVGLPIVTTDPLAFSNRGYIWEISLRQWAENPWFGSGSQWYSYIARYQTELTGSAFHAHNEAVQSLVIGGALLAAVLGVQMLILTGIGTLDAVRKVRVSAIYISVLMVSCWFEVSFAIVDRLLLVPVTILPMAFFWFRSRSRSGSNASLNVTSHPALTHS